MEREGWCWPTAMHKHKSEPYFLWPLRPECETAKLLNMPVILVWISNVKLQLGVICQPLKGHELKLLIFKRVIGCQSPRRTQDRKVKWDVFRKRKA